MRSFSSLVHNALFPSTRVYHDANGNYRGTSTDVTPWMLLIGRVWGYCVDWGQNRLPYKYSQPSQYYQESTWNPDHPELYQDPYKEYKERRIGSKPDGNTIFGI